MISKALDMENRFLILPGLQQIDFDEFLTFYVEKSWKNQKTTKNIKNQKIQNSTPYQKSLKKRLAMPNINFSTYFPKNLKIMIFHIFINFMIFLILNYFSVKKKQKMR